jgi:hypothetical protein
MDSGVHDPLTGGSLKGNKACIGIEDDAGDERGFWIVIDIFFTAVKLRYE